MFFFVCNFLKILMVSDKTIHKAFRIHKTVTESIRECLDFQYLPKLYIGFNTLFLLLPL